MKISIAISGAALLVYSSLIYAGDWTSYTNSDNVRQIALDSGRVWGATSGGVVAYTPSTGDILKLTNTDGLGGIDFNCVEVDTAGNLWFGTSNGWISKYTMSGVITNYPVRDRSGFFAREVAIFDFAVDGDRLWVANDLGVSKFLIYVNGGEIKDTAKKLGNIDPEEDVACLAIIGNNLWAGTIRGLAFIDKDNENIQNYEFWRSFPDSVGGNYGLGDLDIRSIEAYYDTVVVGTQSGIYKLLTDPDTSWSLMAYSGHRVRRLLTADGILYAATHVGIYQYDGSAWTEMATGGLPSSKASDLALDSTGILWAGTMASGLAGLVDTIWTLYSIPGPASNFIKAISIDSSGAIWMAHDDKGLSKLENGEWTVYNSANSDPDGDGPLGGLEDNAIHTTRIAADGTFWAGSWGGGLYKYDGISWYHWKASNCPMFGVASNPDYWAASAVEFDPGGNLWVSSLDADSGLVMGAFDPVDSIWHLYFTSPTYSLDNTVLTLLAQGSAMFVGTTTGLHRLSFGGTPFDESDDTWQRESDEFIVDTAMDPFGNLWLGALTGLYYDSVATGIVRQVELPPEIFGRVNAVASDGVGNIWVGTVSGLGVLRPDKKSWQTTYTTENSPLLNNEINDVEIKAETGIIYIGTVGGFSIFYSGIEAPSEDLSDVEAYPNPVLIPQGDERVYFNRVPPDATISIYTVSGDLVHTFPFSFDGWNLRNSKGEPVAGGVYIFLVESGEISGTGKFAIIK